MIIIRGVNIYPSSVEQIVREFTDVDEFRLIVRKEARRSAHRRGRGPRRIAASLNDCNFVWG
jgi:phenylacetate-CoA ligase